MELDNFELDDAALKAAEKKARSKLAEDEPHTGDDDYEGARFKRWRRPVVDALWLPQGLMPLPIRQ